MLELLCKLSFPCSCLACGGPACTASQAWACLLQRRAGYFKRHGAKGATQCSTNGFWVAMQRPPALFYALPSCCYSLVPGGWSQPVSPCSIVCKEPDVGVKGTWSAYRAPCVPSSSSIVCWWKVCVLYRRCCDCSLWAPDVYQHSVMQATPRSLRTRALATRFLSDAQLSNLHPKFKSV